MVAAAHDRLRREHFDIDPESDGLLRLQRDAVLAVGHTLAAAAPAAAVVPLPPLVANRGGGGGLHRGELGVAVDTSTLRAAVDTVAAGLEQLDDGGATTLPDLEAVAAAVEAVTAAPVVFPPFFFTHATPTDVQIAVHPFPKAGQVATVQPDSELVLRVEGFVRRPPHRVPRRIGAMEVEVTADSTAHPTPTVVTRRVPVTRRFFRTSFLLGFPAVPAGAEVAVSIKIKAYFCDTDGTQWAAHAAEGFEVTLGGRSQGPRR